jgi:hypothetical protein
MVNGTPSRDMRSQVPVALFAYARPQHLIRTLECLRANRVPRIYAFSDGPKTPEQRAKVEEVRRLLRAVDWCEMSIVARAENLGLGESIRAGVADVLSRHESVLVFEDDLICVDGTYAYLTEALAHYGNDPRVMSVTGWTHPRITPRDVTDQPFFDGRAECLVWGTWRRAWDGMEQDARSLMQRCRQKGIDPYAYGADLVQMAQTERERNIWAVRFIYLHILNGSLCLRPPHSLVEHIGFDTDATNAIADNGWANPPLRPCPSLPATWPDAVEHPQAQSLAAAAFGRKPEPPSFRLRLRSAVRRALPVSVVRACRWLRPGSAPAQS